MKTTIGITSAALLLASIAAANWLTSTFGFVAVGFGLAATAGTFAAGLMLALRDAVQDTIGKRWTVAVIATGAVISYLIADPFVATASAAAFALAEFADFAVYTPIRNKARLGGKRWASAVVASNLIGAVIDTAVFVGIAFGAYAIAPAMAGQLVGKAWATLAYLIIGKAASGTVLRKPNQFPSRA